MRFKSFKIVRRAGLSLNTGLVSIKYRLNYKLIVCFVKKLHLILVFVELLKISVIST